MRRMTRRVRVSARLVALELMRNRIAVTLLLVLPTVFYLVVYATTGDRPIDFQLSATGREVLNASERDLSMLFIGMASISGVSAFLAFVLVLRPGITDRRLVFEGFHPLQLLLAKMLVVLVAALGVAFYITALLPLFFKPPRGVGVFAGFFLASLVYGGLGMAVGAVARRDLEGILFILLLVNIDAGWLQNPVFYGHAHNQGLIRILPGHHPGQVSMVSAFTGQAVLPEVASALFYAAAFFLVAGALYWRKVYVRTR